jgi:DME family drug/metabolite transporter
MNKKSSGYLLVLLAATLWGTLGLFYYFLTSVYFLPQVQIIFWRALFASLFTFCLLSFWRRSEITIPRKYLWLFILLGVVGVAGFFIVYIYAISEIGMGVASVLLYSAALWVALYGILFEGEGFGKTKMLAIFLALAGIVLIGGVYNLTNTQFSLLGILAGLGAGLGYASYIILNKRVSQQGYSTWTANAYGLGIGAIALLVVQQPSQLAQTITNLPAMFWLVLLGIIPTLGGGLAFYAGLQRLPAVNASIVATFEPVVATTLGWLILSERLALPQILGGFLILGSVILIQLPGE